MLRILPPLEADGPTHMAADEALLEAAGPTTLRLYAWRPATVSLGYFQDHAPIAAQLPPGMPVVRRITGGGAIWHEHEVTYCLVGHLGRDGLPERARDCYPLLHGAVLAALSQSGARLARQAVASGDRRYLAEPRCFASPAVDDLVADAGGKVLGSAARTRGARILVHGSLKLASNPWDAGAVAACGLDHAAAAAALEAGLLAALGATGRAQRGDWTADEIAARARIRAARYADAAWVRERRGPRP